MRKNLDHSKPFNEHSKTQKKRGWYMRYRKIQAKYKVATPMFLSGGDQDKAELRVVSIKGVLRFWFRATALSQYDSWLKVKEAEQLLFGSADAGQGAFLIKIHSKQIDKSVNRDWFKFGSNYLGYGLDKTKTSRQYIKPGGVFTIEVIFKPGTSDDCVAAIKRSLIALGLFGGLGARSRRGYGSLSLESLTVDNNEVWNKPKNQQDLLSLLNNFIEELGQLPVELPEYTAFSKKSRIALTITNNNPMKLLNIMGREMMNYRGAKTNPIFKQDAAKIIRLTKGQTIEEHPQRIVFGLPHNYYFPRPFKESISINANELQRRASPLFIHIHELENSYVSILTLLPAVFLPKNQKIFLSCKKANRSVNTNVNYNVIHNFIDSFANRLEVTI
ncbi:type III-B CRISPR module RAMP protein Cmr1 [Peptococcaceae bacterium 1198_IL3148]